MANNKFKLLDEEIIFGKSLHRIQALYSFGNVKAGDIGGYVENEHNLSTYGECWIYGNAKVIDSAFICENAKIFNFSTIEDKAYIRGNAQIRGTSLISDHVLVEGDAIIEDRTVLSGNVRVSENAQINLTEYKYDYRIKEPAHFGKNAVIRSQNDYICIGPIGSRRDTVTFYKTFNDDIWVTTGCFNGSLNDFSVNVDKNHINGIYHEEYVHAIDLALLYFEHNNMGRK